MRQYTAHYEMLRAQVTGPTPGQGQLRGIGLALLLREGVPGWLKAVRDLLRVQLSRASAESRKTEGRSLSVSLPNEAAAAGTVPSGRPHEITMLLASLVLSTRHPTVAR
ncbi:hypothetical protein LMG9964_06472 [Paraburkholderia phenoliruptrix]|uniref:Uncharacterized protein n=1 Tax=Paraburkholderia phenoliruptrix TaxID=252970 RepID=A0A6J5KHS7_9BURK|nr:hypothetical protein LMG9964_06472 [Paraburkholderia phenoliruptrix]